MSLYCRYCHRLFSRADSRIRNEKHSSQSSGSGLSVKWPITKKYYAKNRHQILVQQKRYRAENVGILKTRRKRWYEDNKERLASSQRAYCQQNKEHIRNYRRQYCKTTGNGSTNIGEVIMPRIRNGSGKDLVT